MDRDELRGLLNNIRNERFMAKIIDEVDKAARNLKIKWFDFLEAEILKFHGIKPMLNVVPPKKRILLNDFFDEAHELGNKGAFDHRDNPQMFKDYCDPFSDKRDMYLDEMKPQQRKVIAMMNEDMNSFKRKGNRSINTSGIEDALDNVIRVQAREREKGSDTTE